MVATGVLDLVGVWKILNFVCNYFITTVIMANNVEECK